MGTDVLLLNLKWHLEPFWFNTQITTKQRGQRKRVLPASLFNSLLSPIALTLQVFLF